MDQSRCITNWYLKISLNFNWHPYFNYTDEYINPSDTTAHKLYYITTYYFTSDMVILLADIINMFQFK